VERFPKKNISEGSVQSEPFFGQSSPTVDFEDRVRTFVEARSPKQPGIEKWCLLFTLLMTCESCGVTSRLSSFPKAGIPDFSRPLGWSCRSVVPFSSPRLFRFSVSSCAREIRPLGGKRPPYDEARLLSRRVLTDFAASLEVPPPPEGVGARTEAPESEMLLKRRLPARRIGLGRCPFLKSFSRVPHLESPSPPCLARRSRE